MPFALNEATRFISPTKTPEFLAAGVPVVSTPITDVVRPYGEKGLVEIAETPLEVGAQGRGAARAAAGGLAGAGGPAPGRRLLGQDLGGDAQADARRPCGRAPRERRRSAAAPYAITRRRSRPHV